ncbi:hypothetical protein [Bdellovibrio bacteriovorus]|uniref:hypothetical protein n=1 Tax=Bdellovibrio bacteriovorus TaxID=959 RepID=UPI0035A73A07
MKFIPIYEALTIKAQKNSPPHIAFEEVLESERRDSEWARIEKIKPVNLAHEKTSSAPLFAKRVELPAMVIQKTSERILASEALPLSAEREEEVNNTWIEQLPRTQAVRLQEAQRRSEVLGQDWQGSTWSAMAKETLEKSGVLNPAPEKTNVYVAGAGPSGKTQVPKSKVYFPNESQGRTPSSSDTSATGGGEMLPSYGLAGETAGAKSIVGPLEITGGLAVTNEHHIEIRRSDEGILKELGSVDLQQGLYNIQVQEPTGSVIARLVDKDGKTLGEGSFRLTHVATNQAERVSGPKLKIEPHPDFAGIVTSAYNAKPTDAAPAQTKVTFVKGLSEVAAKKDGFVSMDNVTKGSSTVMRAAAPRHMQTASIVVSGKEFKSQLYPDSMIQALQNIVAQQRAQSFEGAPTIIWGKVALDGKNVSGIDVVVESDPSLQPVYFNQFMIPDATLKTTSENGLFAFVNVQPGFHSLLATRADSIFGYQNVVVEEGSVAQGDIESTIKSEAVPLRVYDAFTGEARSATVTMQSLQEDLEVKTGTTTISLPHISRLGMMRIQPEGADYVAARYLYNDTDAFIHAPLVHWSWLSSIKSYLRIDDAPSAGLIVGFVPDEDFEVYLAAYDGFESRHIVYFDMQGRILQNRKGIAGGGFILYNVPEDIHEVVVVGARTQKVYSRVLPVDANSLSVLNFRE